MKFLGLNATQWTAIGKLALVGVTTVYVILAGRLAASSKRSSESAEVQGRITAELVLDRFKNRPDEPTWQITDAIEKGDVGLALRRLFDFLVHGHPLLYLAALETDLEERALAAAAPDQETFKDWMGARARIGSSSGTGRGAVE